MTLIARYNSDGERKIAEFLRYSGIHYKYEPPLLLNDHGYQRIWYPDFGLPKYSVFIEYFGVENDHNYDERTKYKLDRYRENQIDVIALYPSDLKGDYGGYILDRIHHTLDNRLSDLEQKIKQYHARPTFANRAVFKNYSVSGNGYR